MHLMPLPQFEKLKARWELIIAHPQSRQNLDVFARELLPVLNTHPQLVSIFSCDGHWGPQGEQYPEGYIMLGVRDLNVIYALYEAILKHLPPSEQHRVKLSMTRRVDITASKPNTDAWYPVYLLSWRYGNDDERFFLETALAEAVKEVCHA